jgi:hypothetical protein
MFAAQSLNDIVETYGQHNTILDNCFLYPAFGALDPLTQDKVSEGDEGTAEPGRRPGHRPRPDAQPARRSGGPPAK